MGIIIETQNLTKTFKMGQQEIEVLRGIDMTVDQGEFVSIMGPSGSGKSTLLYLIGGLDKPTTGKVFVGGKELSSMKDKAESKMRRQDIGFVFQFYNLIPNLNLEENVMLPALLDGHKPKSLKPRLNRILDLVGLSDRRHHTPRELSGGQQQRVAIARALLNEPEIIMADEPIGNLDSNTGLEIMNLLREINRQEKRTIIQVTHSAEAAGYGQRTIHVKDGRILEQ